MYPSMDTQSNYKIVIDGANHSGKTSILRRISRNTFVEKPTDTQPHIISHPVCIEGPRLINLEIWDRVSAIESKLLFENVNAAVFVYDISDRISYEKALKRLWKIRKRLEKEERKIVYALVGSKSDLIEYREVQMEEALEQAKEYGLDVCLEISSKTSVNIPGIFTIIARKLDRKTHSSSTSSLLPTKIDPLLPKTTVTTTTNNPPSKLAKIANFLLCCR